MTENPNQDNLDSSEEPKVVQAGMDVVAAEQQEIIPPIHEAKNMEVHHHAHAHGKKNWRSYFWEFMMLFLAVFCGFLAEYQLEHVIEDQREKQYMQSLVYDLQSDTAALNYGIPLKAQRLLAIDSMFAFFAAHPNTKTIPGAVFRHMRRSLWDRHYRRNSTTMDQLKNAGGLRLIRKKNVRDSIAGYDLQWQRAEFWREAYVTLQEKGKGFVHKIINANDLLRRQLNFQNDRDAYDSIKVAINTESLNEFLNFSADQKLSTSQDRRGYEAIEKSAERLISLIQTEYKLE